jgi:hypothetical protein
MEEVSVDLYVREGGMVSIAALISDEKAWLSVTDLFDFLKINYLSSPHHNQLSGFFISNDVKYMLDVKSGQLNFNGIKTQLPENVLKKQNNILYLQSDFFNPLFKLDSKFDFRSLTVNLTTLLELPMILEKKQEWMRNNIGNLRNELKADTTLGKIYTGFNVGMIDWSVNTAQDFKGSHDTRANIALGAVVLGGETTIAVQLNDQTLLSGKQQYYLWHSVNNENLLLKQVSLGKINFNATSSIFASVIGVQFSNHPSVLLRNFGTYRLNRTTQPGWMVELYVNGVLIDYRKADAAGYIGFDVPVIYGSTRILLKYYGPNGEQRSTEGNISMPYIFIPVGKLEYTLSAGLVEDSSWSKYSRLQLNYGLIKRLTIGTGVEYLSSITNLKTMPFYTADFRLGRNLMFATEYTPNVRSMLSSNLQLTPNLLVELNATSYTPGQQAIANNYLSEIRAAVSFPLNYKKINVYSKFSYYQIQLHGASYTTAQAYFTGLIMGISSNFSTYALFIENSKAIWYSNLALAIRLPAKFLFMPQVQYNYNSKSIISLRAEVQNPITKKGFLNFYYENNFQNNFQSINIGFRYQFPFANLAVTMLKTSGMTPTIISSMAGGFVYDRRSSFTNFTNTPAVGRGGLILSAFIDLNNNGIREKGEPKVEGLLFSISGGSRKENKRDTSVVISNLEGYYEYLLKIDKNSFDEIDWKIKTGSMKVVIRPNEFRVIEIPISVVAEVSGKVYQQTENGRIPMERIYLDIFNERRVLVAKILSETDGFYSYMGLPKGTFTIKPDATQLMKLNLQNPAGEFKCIVKSSINGDTYTNIDFMLEAVPLKLHK